MNVRVLIRTTALACVLFLSVSCTRVPSDTASNPPAAPQAPTAPTPAFKLGEKVNDPLAMYLADIYTVTANLAGIPGISIPCGESREGLPIGLQLFGRHFDEATVLRAGRALEIGADFNAKPAQWWRAA